MLWYVYREYFLKLSVAFLMLLEFNYRQTVAIMPWVNNDSEIDTISMKIKITIMDI